MLKNKFDRCLIITYICTEAILLCLIKWAEMTQAFSVYGKIEYGAILLNFSLMAYYFMKKKETGKHSLIPLALTMTLVADYFLTLTGSHFLTGVFCFVIVQLIYGWKIGYRMENVMARIFLFLAFFLSINLMGMSISFAAFCGTSIAVLLGNVYFSFRIWKRSGRTLDEIFFLGLLLFAGCDLSLGLSLVSEGVRQLSTFHDIVKNMVWIFYVPSQVLLTLSYVMEIEN